MRVVDTLGGSSGSGELLVVKPEYLEVVEPSPAAFEGTHQMAAPAPDADAEDNEQTRGSRVWNSLANKSVVV